MKRKFFHLGRVALSVSALGILFYIIDFDAFIDIVLNADIKHYSVSLAFFCMLPLLNAFRWRAACSLSGTQTRYGAHLRIGMVASFYGQVLPTSVGADAVRVWLYHKTAGSIAAAISGVLIDRISGLLALLLLVTATYPLHDMIINDEVGRTLVAGGSAGSLAILLSTIGAAFLSLRLIERIPLTRVRAAVAALHRTLRHPRLLTNLIVVSLLTHAVTVIGIVQLAESLGAPLSLSAGMVLIPPSFLIMLLPVSISGWGLRESAFVVFLQYAGISSEKSVAISIMFGLTMLLIYLPLGFSAILRRDLVLVEDTAATDFDQLDKSRPLDHKC